MPSTRKQKAKARKSRVLDMLSDYGNMDVMLDEGNSNSIERELDSLISVPERQQDFQSFPNRQNSSQENEIRDIDSRNEPVTESRLVESINMLSGEMNARMSHEMEAMMDLMQSQISSAISSAISERIIPEIQNMVENLPLSQRGVEPCTSTNEEGIGNVWKNANTKFSKKDSRSACDLRDHMDNVPYTRTTLYHLYLYQHRGGMWKINENEAYEFTSTIAQGEFVISDRNIHSIQVDIV